MRLYKNVDIRDLESILTNGILSIDASGNDNWNSGRRADNRTDCVYLFKPISKENSFTSYGIALVEVEVDAVQSVIAESDYYFGKYEEYTIPYVSPDQIVAVYVPDIFRGRIADSPVLNRITFVKMSAKTYGKDGKRPATDAELCVFGQTAAISSQNYNYFRGIKQDRTIIDLYEIHYSISNEL